MYVRRSGKYEHQPPQSKHDLIIHQKMAEEEEEEKDEGKTRLQLVHGS